MADRQELLPQLLEARAITDRLFTHLDPAALYDRPIAERHRMIFYLGHLEAFDWNQIKSGGFGKKSFEPVFDQLFAFGIDPEPGQLPHDQPADWPSAEQVLQYNARVRESVDRYLGQVPYDLIRMMIEHRHMHAETFTYILHNLDPGKKRGPSCARGGTKIPIGQESIVIPAGIATLGMQPGGAFGWDNEFGETAQFVPPFSISRYKVTNGEFLDYMVATGARAPHYWFRQGDEWYYRGVFNSFPLPLTWPVYVAWEQAAAYAAFQRAALPTEAQFHRAAFGTPQEGRERAQPWIEPLPGAGASGNFGYASWDPIPVDASPATESAWGVAQLVGNGWEWTQTLFAPFAGFAPRPEYPGYSANFFDNAHYVLKGASPRTSAELVRRSLRNWYRPEYPYVYGTFHLVYN